VSILTRSSRLLTYSCQHRDTRCIVSALLHAVVNSRKFYNLRLARRDLPCTEFYNLRFDGNGVLAGIDKSGAHDYALHLGIRHLERLLRFVCWRGISSSAWSCTSEVKLKLRLAQNMPIPRDLSRGRTPGQVLLDSAASHEARMRQADPAVIQNASSQLAVNTPPSLINALFTPFPNSRRQHLFRTISPWTLPNPLALDCVYEPSSRSTLGARVGLSS
jgi:hypothetical protein